MIKFFLVSLMLVFPAYAKKTVVLPELLQPESIDIMGDKAFILDKMNIRIYSLKDFKHIKSFGKQGEGPGEFRFEVDLTVLPDFLFVNTMGKIIFFNLDGGFISEMKKPYQFFRICPLGNNYVVSIFEKNKQTIGIYDKNLKIIKNIFQGSIGQVGYFETGVSKKQDVIMIRDYAAYFVYKDKIYIGDTTEGFYFSVFDSNGEKLYESSRKYEKLRITDKVKDALMKEEQESPYWQSYKDKFNYIFPDYLPAYYSMKVADDKIYFVTYRNINNEDEVIITDLKGGFLRKTTLPASPYSKNNLFCFYHDKIYYLEENEEQETWVLHEL